MIFNQNKTTEMRHTTNSVEEWKRCSEYGSINTSGQRL